MKSIKLAAKPRTENGSTAVGRVRRGGWFPAVVYGAGKANRNIQLNEHDFRQLLKGHTGENILLDLEVEGDTTFKVLLKELQHHPLSGHILHADFYEISMTKKLRIELAIALVGEPVGVTQQGGILEHLLRTVEVECLPTDIVEKVVLDVSGLSIGHHLTVSDIKLDPAKYHIISDASLAVAIVSAPRAEEVAAPTPEEAAAAAAGPEVITEKKAEEGEAAEGEGKEGKKAAGGKEEAKKPAAGGKEEAKGKEKK
jgi:large subunit ribosomal protein L25